MHLLVTGASGLVGGALVATAAKAGHRVTALVHRFEGKLPGAEAVRRVDLSSAEAVERAVLEAAPEAIVNAAALSEPAQCDAQPELSQQLNVALPEQLARLAARAGARLIHLSSEQVFDGTRPPYAPTDPVSPLNRYGRQKVESEQRVQAAAPSLAATLRLPLLSGNSPGGKRSLHERLFLSWSEGKPTRQHTDEIRQPCTAENLAAVVTELCGRRDLVGVFHWAGAEPLSRHEMGIKLLAHFRLPAAWIEDARRTDDPKTAARPADLSLSLDPLAGALRTRPQTFDEQLATLRVPAFARAWYESARATA